LTLTDQEQAREIALLASARYNLYVIDLTSAENYHLNLIDNSFSENWSIADRHQHINIMKSYKVESVIKISKLDAVEIADPDIAKEKEYLQTVWYYYKYCTEVEQRPWNLIENWVGDMLGTEIVDQTYTKIKQHVRQIKKTLYLGQDAAQINHDIQQIKNNYRS
jgi:hypothetical protein